MKAKNYIVYVLMILMAIQACKPGMKPEDQEAVSDQADKTYPVVVQTITPVEITRKLDYAANLVASKEINYAPASPGRIEKIHVEIGDRVKTGQLLVETDRTQLLQAQTQLASARDNFRRLDTLRALGSIAEQQYDQAKTQLDLAQSNVDFLLKNTTLKSPINGIVTGKYYENGELYSGAPNTQAGKAAVLSLMQIDPLKAMVSISQSYFPDIKKGQRVTITSDIFQNQTFEGTVSKVYPTIDAATRTFKTEILVKNPQELLRPGMYAEITIDLENDQAVLVPAIAIMKQAGTNERYIFVAANGLARKVVVSLGKRYDDQVEITAAQSLEGASLIVDGQARLLDGSKIEIVKSGDKN